MLVRNFVAIAISCEKRRHLQFTTRAHEVPSSRRHPLSSFVRGLILPAVCLVAATGLHCASAGENPPGAPIPPAIRPIQIAGIENAYQLGERFISGSAPADDAAFKALARLGVKTIISVDGAKPDVEAARRNGLRYVHLPHGYDGIPRSVAARLVKAAATFPGNIYIHCHHGKHRGPAAAALICEASEGWSRAQASEWLKLAGTAPEYVGLYESVGAFKVPSPAELAATSTEFPETVEVSSLVDSMVEIDRLWDSLKGAHAAKSSATLLREQFRELQRTPEALEHGSDFLAGLQQAEKAAAALAADFSKPLALGGNAHLQSLKQVCTECHRTHRDPPEALRKAK